MAADLSVKTRCFPIIFRGRKHRSEWSETPRWLPGNDGRKKEHGGKERRESNKRGEIREKRKWVVVCLKVEFAGREERKKMKERDGGSEKSFNYTVIFFLNFLIF